MSSGYYTELYETAKTGYDEKLSCNGNKLPDPFDQSTMEHVFVYNKKLWPPITFGGIYMYLVEKECTYTRGKMRNHKSLDAFNYVLSGKEHNPDAPYLEDLTDEEETSSASET
ncbi:hypothetical protein TNCV_3327361 [Trichonephila clavipes]|nr:hypothetical protein TNCV_3327361 [Trichonephila clavipes]